MQILDMVLEVAVKRREINPSSIISDDKRSKDETLSITHEKKLLRYFKKLQIEIPAMYLLSFSPQLQAKVFD